MSRVVALALVARKGGSAALARFYVLLAAATGALPTTADVPSTAPSAPPTVIQSSNWSGYAATGGPYSAVKGTFTVPGIVPGTPSGAQVSEWVGIDGERGGTSSSRQAYASTPTLRTNRASTSNLVGILPNAARISQL